MPNQDDKFWGDIVGKLRWALRLRELSKEEADREYETAKESSLSDDRIDFIVEAAIDAKTPDWSTEPDNCSWTPNLDDKVIANQGSQLNRRVGERNNEELNDKRNQWQFVLAIVGIVVGLLSWLTGTIETTDVILLRVQRLLPIGYALALVALWLAAIIWLHIPQNVKTLVRQLRQRHPESRHSGRLVYTALKAAVYRARYRMQGSEHWHMVRRSLTHGLLMAIGVVVTERLAGFYTGIQVSHPYYVYGWVFLLVAGGSQWTQIVAGKFRKRRPTATREIKGEVLQRVCDAYKRVPLFEDMIRKEQHPFNYGIRIATKDKGPVRICAVNAIEMIDPKLEGVDVPAILEAVWETNPSQTFKWFLADPGSVTIQERARRLHGRYLEYNIVRFLLMMFRWKEEKNSAAEKNKPARIELRTYTTEPFYRMMLTENFLIARHYGRDRYRRQDEPLILGRAGYEEIYRYYSYAFEQRWKGAEREEHFILDWGIARLKNFTAACGMDEATIGQNCGTSRALATKLCEHLDQVVPGFNLRQKMAECFSELHPTS